MTGQAKGIVIRTAFNNQGWAGRCIKPLSDPRCMKCKEGKLFINEGKPISEEDENGYCKGYDSETFPLISLADEDEHFWCWEQVLCKKYFWGNVIGKWRKAFGGMPAYFVYTELDGTLTLWGHSVIDEVDNEPEKYPPIYFKPFEPMQKDMWVKGLTGEEITGKKWGQLHFRYLDENHEQYLASLVRGEGKKEYIKRDAPSLKRYEGLLIELKKDIKEKLVKIAKNEGREIQDIIREAVAKLINERGF